jgi:excisionase family DNA binding protein
MDEKVYTVREFAKVMKLSESMAYRMCREGKVKTVKFGDRYLIPVKVVDDILSQAQNAH